MIEIRVFGELAPQGSKRRVARDVMIEACKKLKPWREAVTWAAREHGGKIVGPVGVRMVFTVRKPTTAPKRRKTWPARRPDIDKLCRAVCDALTAAGTWEDDSRVIELLAYKVYPDEGPDALDVPGVVIQVWPVEA
jgi:crossover junction endodeoxyribonuclease RusA